LKQTEPLKQPGVNPSHAAEARFLILKPTTETNDTLAPGTNPKHAQHR
jgi:hypothetical protein